MINKISIKNTAAYNSIEIAPKKINFIFGANGTGKTTLSSVIQGEISDNCSVEWENSIKKGVFVYNKKFVLDNFRQENNISGIFTLGKEAVDIKEKINILKDKRIDCNKLHIKYSNTLSEKNTELLNIQKKIKNSCWYLKTQYSWQFLKALTGVLGSKDVFFKQCLSIYNSTDYKSEEVKNITLEYLKKEYAQLFDKNRQPLAQFKKINFENIHTYETLELLETPIVGSKESPLSTFIDFLHNSDWVKQGLFFANQLEGTRCPFCQQSLTKNIYESLKSFFDKTYEENCIKIIKFTDNYSNYISNIIKNIESIIYSNYDIIEYESLIIEKERIKNIFEENIKSLNIKNTNPSKTISIHSLKEELISVNKIIDNFNNIILQDAEKINCRLTLQENLKTKIWHYFVYIKDADIKEYIQQSTKLNRACEGITGRIKKCKQDITNKTMEIEELEQQQTSILPSIDYINNILKTYDFTGFELKKNEVNNTCYKLVRPSGEDVGGTLSEGEYNFITFLYFIQLIQGSSSPEGTLSDRIIMIDDPISSLDSNILFIITGLIKDIVIKCKEENSNIKQIFISTHNTYFYKEITFYGSRVQENSEYYLYWHIKKKNNISNIITYKNNPIKTIYEMLWDDIKNDEQISPNTIFNTMRRILEHYFQIIGGKKYEEEVISTFAEEYKIICRALISCINDGSHTIPDSFTYCLTIDDIKKYKKVFRLIFENLGHSSHYEMMMGR